MNFKVKTSVFLLQVLSFSLFLSYNERGILKLIKKYYKYEKLMNTNRI